jgi:hypothetical protein
LIPKNRTRYAPGASIGFNISKNDIAKPRVAKAMDKTPRMRPIMTDRAKVFFMDIAFLSSLASERCTHTQITKNARAPNIQALNH